MAKDGIPLPSALSGVEVERLVKIDGALLFLILGALVELTDNWWLEQTGTLTIDDAKAALNDMLWCFMEGCDVTPVGTIAMYPTDTTPAKWLKCAGASLLRADYPDLFAVIGTTYGAADGTHFNLPNWKSKSPYGGESTGVPLGSDGGQATMTLAVTHLPAHNHRERHSTGVNSFVFSSAGGANPAIPSTATVGATALNTGDTGGNSPFTLLHPVFAINYIIYAGV